MKTRSNRFYLPLDRRVPWPRITCSKPHRLAASQMTVPAAFEMQDGSQSVESALKSPASMYGVRAQSNSPRLSNLTSDLAKPLWS